MSTYQLDLTDKDFARIVDALQHYARTLHSRVAQAEACGYHDAAQVEYADALGFELLAHRLVHMPSLDDVLRMLQGVSQ